MGENRATFQAYDDQPIEVRLLSGRVIRGRCFTVEEGVRFYRLQQEAGAGSVSAQLQIMEELPRVLGIGGQRCSPIELVGEVLDAFLSHRGPQAEPAAATDPSSISVSTT